MPDPEPQDDDKDPLQERLGDLTKQQGAIEERIKSEGEATTDLESKVDAGISTLSSQLDEAGSAIQEYHVSLSKQVTGRLISARQSINDTLRKASYSLTTYLFFQASFTVVIGVMGGYLFWRFWPPALAPFVGVWAVVSAIVLWDVNDKLRRISEHSKQIQTEVDNLNTEIAESASKYPEPKQDISPVLELLGMLKDASEQVVIQAGKAFHVSSDIIDQHDKNFSRDQFIEKFSFALKRYGFNSYDAKAQLRFKSKPQWVGDQTAWLESLTTVAEGLFDRVPAILFKLMFYETWDRDNISATWDTVRNDSDLRLGLARIFISHELVDSEPSWGNVDISLSDLLHRIDEKEFELAEVRRRAADYFVDLTIFKRNCLDILDSHGLKIVIRREQFLSFPPQSSQPAEWKVEVIDFLASHVLGANGEPPDGKAESNEVKLDPSTDSDFIIERLILLEGLGDESRRGLWKKVLRSDKSDELLQRVATILTTKMVKKPYDDFADEVFLAHLVLVLKYSTDDFLIQAIVKRVSELESNILSVKRGMIRTSQKYHLGLDEFAFAGSFKPPTPSEVRENLLKELASKVGIIPELARLLYYSAVGADEADQTFREIVNEHIKAMQDNSEASKRTTLQALSDFLIDRKFVPVRKFNDGLPALLITQPTLDLATFRDVYAQYDALMSRLSSLVTFLAEHELAISHAQPTFREILSVCPPSDSLDFLDMLVKAASAMITRNLGGTILNDDQHLQLCVAASALSLRIEFDSSSEDLAKKLYWKPKPFGARVLFMYSKITRENITKQPTLMQAAIRAIPELSGDPNFDYYLEKLRDGIIVLAANELVAMRKGDFEALKKRAGDLGLENIILVNYVESAKEFLSKVDVDVTREFLFTETVSAYVLTTPHSSALFKFMNENPEHLAKAAKNLAERKKDDTFLNLLQDEKMGMAARIGLVPYDVKFEKFADMVTEYFEEARKLAGKPKSPSFFLVRIFPSDDALKVVAEADFEGKKPLEVVTALIQKYLKGYDAASARSLLEPTPRTSSAFNIVLTKLIDSKENNLYTLIKDLASDIVKGNPELRDAFAAKLIDHELQTLYVASGTTDMCKKIQDKRQVWNEDEIKKDFEEKVRPIFQKQPGLTDTQRDFMVGALYRRIRVIGTVLYS